MPFETPFDKVAALRIQFENPWARNSKDRTLGILLTLSEDEVRILMRPMPNPLAITDYFEHERYTARQGMLRALGERIASTLLAKLSEP